MALFTFSKPEKEAISQKIQEYFQNELDQEIGNLQAGLLLTFIAEEVGPFFYNKGVRDSQVALSKRIDELTEALDALQKPTGAR